MAQEKNGTENTKPETSARAKYFSGERNRHLKVKTAQETLQ
jgi:hypothetical protein